MSAPETSAPQQALSYNDVFDDDDVDEPKSVHHIRANSSIMQLKKILGEPPRASLALPRPRIR